MQEKTYNTVMNKLFIFLLTLCLVFGSYSAVASDESKLNKQINSINSEINSANAQINYFNSQLDELGRDLDHVHKELESLNHTLGSLYSEIQTSESKLAIYQNQQELLVQKQDQLRELIASLKIQKDKLASELSQLLVQFYLEAEASGVFDNQDLRFLKLVLNERTATEILEDLDKLSHLENILLASIEKLENNLADLNQKDIELKSSLQANLALQNTILNEQRQLAGFVEAQNNLVAIQKTKQTTLADLIARSKAQQQESMNLLKNLSTQKADIEDKLTKLRLARKQKNKPNASSKEVNLDTNFIWPVPTARGISAFFRDPEYFSLFGIPHNAIDVPLPMQTPIKAPEDGVVIKVRGGSGLDYHYLIVEHPNGYRSLYGHVYRILVSQGDVVSQGQVIALSGGLPGTTGAGFLSTGAHLHLEFTRNGSYLNPLSVLP